MSFLETESALNSPPQARKPGRQEWVEEVWTHIPTCCFKTPGEETFSNLIVVKTLSLHGKHLKAL